MTRTLSDRDIREVNVDPYHESLGLTHVKEDKRKGDRRKAINSWVDPKHERRCFDRRKN